MGDEYDLADKGVRGSQDSVFGLYETEGEGGGGPEEEGSGESIPSSVGSSLPVESTESSTDALRRDQESTEFSKILLQKKKPQKKGQGSSGYGGSVKKGKKKKKKKDESSDEDEQFGMVKKVVKNWKKMIIMQNVWGNLMCEHEQEQKKLREEYCREGLRARGMGRSSQFSYGSKGYPYSYPRYSGSGYSGGSEYPYPYPYGSGENGGGSGSGYGPYSDEGRSEQGSASPYGSETPNGSSEDPYGGSEDPYPPYSDEYPYPYSDYPYSDSDYYGSNQKRNYGDDLSELMKPPKPGKCPCPPQPPLTGPFPLLQTVYDPLLSPNGAQRCMAGRTGAFVAPNRDRELGHGHGHKGHHQETTTTTTTESGSESQDEHHDDHDGTAFSYVPSVKGRTEFEITVEPPKKKSPPWLTMMRAGFRPVINCQAPPCYMSPGNYYGLNFGKDEKGNIVNFAKNCQPLPTLQELKDSFRQCQPGGDNNSKSSSSSSSYTKSGSGSYSSQSYPSGSGSGSSRSGSASGSRSGSASGSNS